MECIYCGYELEQIDSYGTGDYILRGDMSGKLGDIYVCVNSEGFETEEEALAYARQSETDYETWEDIICDSGCHGGHFYIDTSGNLKEGYPC